MKKVHLCVIILALLCLPSMTSAQEDTWTAKADMPTVAVWLCTCVLDGKIYAIGGYDGSKTLSTVYEYDPSADTWKKKTDMPATKDSSCAAVVNGKIYAISGLLEEGVSRASTVYEYDPAKDAWEKKADIPTARQEFATGVVDGKIYAFGGDRGGRISAVEEYDPVTDTWTKRADMPTARGWLGYTAPVVNGKIYIIGGLLDGDVPSAAVEEYDPVTDTWMKKADMPTARYGMAISEVDGKIYAIGGGSSVAQSISTVEMYDPAADKWTKKADMPTARWSLSASAINGQIYAIGGWGQTGILSTVEAYDTGVGIRVWEVFPQEGWVTGGELIVIHGKEFPLDAEVTIGGNPLGEMEVTDTIITGVIPPGTEGERDILITSPSIDFTVPAGRFFYNPVSNVTVARITPTNGKQAGGEAGSIVGSGFIPGATVTIGDNPATNVGVKSTLITFTIPPGTEGAKDVVVTNPDGQKDTLRGAYTYNPFPVIMKVEPSYGGPLSGGTEMTVTGRNFMEGLVVTIGENRVYQLTFFSPTELRLKTPPGTAGPKAVGVRNPDGQEAVREDGFTYNPAPTITSISPNAGPLEGGMPITITGTGFIHPNVLIGGAEASMRTGLPTRITAETPSSDIGVKDVTVVNPDGQKATLKNAFTYNTAPVIVRVTPDNGRLAGGTRITIQGGGFQPGAEVRISVKQGAYRAASSVEVMSSSIITALTPPGQPGAENVLVLNPDIQIAVLPEGFTYNAMPTITRLIPNHGPSSGGSRITIEGTGFLLGARVAIGEKPATTMVRDDMTIEAVAPPNPQGVWDVKVVNPDTQEVIEPRGYVSVGELVYNYPNPFHASRGTTFRYVTKDQVLAVTVKIFNMRGRPIGAARQVGSNEVKWCDPDVYAGLYIYLMEAELEDGKRKQVRNVMEVIE